MENILKALKIFEKGIKLTAERSDKTPHSVTRALKGEWDAPEIVECAKMVINEKIQEAQNLLADANLVSKAA